MVRLPEEAFLSCIAEKAAPKRVPVPPLIDLHLVEQNQLHHECRLRSLVTDFVDLDSLKKALRQIADRVRSNIMNSNTTIASVYN